MRFLLQVPLWSPRWLPLRFSMQLLPSLLGLLAVIGFGAHARTGDRSLRR